MARVALTPALALALLAAWSCGAEDPPHPVAGDEAARIRAELRDRSFRQFDPSRDASPRKAVVLDFSGPLTIWAQYAEDGRAVSEWEIVAGGYRIDGRGDGSEITIHLDRPRSTQIFPTPCDDCVPTGGVSISVRDLFDRSRISFRLNDPDRVLPSPFPVFSSWTRFAEDEYVD